MSRFFDLLPTDIHICLFQTWMCNPLDGDVSMLRGMAALDSATSNHSLRPAFLHLMKLITLSESYSKGKLPFKQFSLIAWLQKLEVGVKSLYFYNDYLAINSRDLPPQFHQNRVCLSTVRSLVIGVGTGLVCIQATLCACPNVTQLDIAGSDIYGRHSQCVWVALLSLPNLKLKKIRIGGDSLDHFRMEEALLMHVGHLEELRLDSFEQSYAEPTILTQCVNLRVLEVNVMHILTTKILTMIRSCLHVKELVLHKYFHHGGPQRLNGVELIIQTAKSKKMAKIDILGGNAGDVGDVESFLEEGVLERYAELDQIQLNSALLARRKKRLTLTESSYHILQHMRPILDYCSVTEAALDSCDLDALLSLVGEKVGSKLKCLVLHATERNGHLLTVPLLSGLFQCPQLTKLVLFRFVLTATALRLIAAACKHLEQMYIIGSFVGFPLCVSADISDAVMSEVFASCKNLKRLQIDCAQHLTYKTLEAIVTHKSRLQIFQYDDVPFTSADVQKFRELARREELLPVTIIQERKHALEYGIQVGDFFDHCV